MIVIGPAAAGKTTLIKQVGGRLIDGDDLIRLTIGWPATPQWWTAPASDPARKAFVEMQARVIAAFDAEHPRGVILFNMDPDVLSRYTRKVMVWIPSEADLRRNAALRKASGNVSQPSDPKEVLANAQTIRGAALRHQWPETTRFQLVSALTGSERIADDTTISKWWDETGEQLRAKGTVIRP